MPKLTPEEMAAIIERLPKYADTGEPFIPGRDEAWVMDEGFGASKVNVAKWAPLYGRWVFATQGGGPWLSVNAYSTVGAAAWQKEGTSCQIGK